MSTAKIKPGDTLGIIGGGQLGRMTALAASSLGLNVCVFCDHKNSPAEQVANSVVIGDYTDKAAIEKFAKKVDVATSEFENIPHETIKALEQKIPVRPGAQAFYLTQNRKREKDFLTKLKIKTAGYEEVKSAKELAAAYKTLGPKCVLKTVELGYDGKGQHIIDKNTKCDELWKKHKLKTAIVEEWISYEKELSVVMARDLEGGAAPYMPSENVHKDGILDTTIAPARVDWEVYEDAWAITCEIADALELIGIIAVEFFYLKDGTLLVNEIAPRPHNSGHWTMDACTTGQFEQLVRAVCGIPMGSNNYHSNAVMKNLIGEDLHLWETFVADPETKIHIYGKEETRPGRKMGHVTHLIAPEDELLES